MHERVFKREIITLLQTATLPKIHDTLRQYDEQQLLNPLFSGICRSEEQLRWHAIVAMGPVVARLADRNMEAARVVMRRIMWSLNDESGGIGWGAPEAMAEILSSHDGLAEEYTHVLVSFMREDGFFIEYEPLQRGLMWGLGRLAESRAKLLIAKGAVTYLLPYLSSGDAAVRGLAARALGRLDGANSFAAFAPLLDDERSVAYWRDSRMVEEKVCDMARLARETASA